MINTAIVSDFHLCEAEPVNNQFPLWKKYKTAEFFFDEEFCNWLDWLESDSEGPIELILNGDTFDFDSVIQLPESPIYRVSWLEKLCGLHAEAEKSRFKIKKILSDHPVFVKGIQDFLARGHKVVIISGNHDVELNFREVQQAIRRSFDPEKQYKNKIHFVDWFYISERDTLVEHGHQYDPYCVLEDPVHPFIQKYDRIEVRLPFGNLATRYILNRMGFFNPHADSNYILSVVEYVRFFFAYMFKAQPLIIWTWFWGSLVTLVEAAQYNLALTVRDPLKVEDKMESIAERSKATPRMVRELRALSVHPAAKNIIQIARELYLDRALMLLIVVYILFTLFLLVRQFIPFSGIWILVAMGIFLPFFLFYSGSIQSRVSEYKEPNDRILALSSMIAKVTRVVYGHTHVPRHELFGPVEHLNSGTWSPAFSDVECNVPVGDKTFVWIKPQDEVRVARLMKFRDGKAMPF